MIDEELKISLNKWIKTKNFKVSGTRYYRKDQVGEIISEVWLNDLPKSPNYGTWYRSFLNTTPEGAVVANKELGMFLCDIDAIECGYAIKDPMLLT